MQTEAVGSSELAVVAGDVLALRGAGLAAPETWALLCQAAQALQDLFLSNGGVVGGSGLGPVVTPRTIELTPRGRVTLQLASPESARAYLPPEYRSGRVYSDTDSEKMWMYSLGRALLDTTPRVAALTGSVSVSPSSALQSVLSAMTEPDPRRRASLMNLLDVISEYCRTRLQSKPFTHIIMDMYREVTRSAQYNARKRAIYPALRVVPGPNQRTHQRANQHQVPQNPNQRLQNTKHQRGSEQQQRQTGHFSKHQIKGALFKAQSRNSRSHPNLLTLSGHDQSLNGHRPQFQSQMDIQSSNIYQQQSKKTAINHTRTNSQPEYSDRVQRGLAQHARSTHNLTMLTNNQRGSQAPRGNVYSDPIYALPVKPFLSSQDVRVNGLMTKSSVDRQDFYGQTITGRPRSIKNGGSSQPNIGHLAKTTNLDDRLVSTDDLGRLESGVGKNCSSSTGQMLHRQYSNPQLPTRNLRETTTGLHRYPQNNVIAVTSRLRVFNGDDKMIDGGQQNNTQINQVSSMKVPSLHGPVPPKPPRVITSLKRTAQYLNQPDNALNESTAPAKPPRLAIKNGPRARRGRPVQRAPSRLYRAIGGSTRCFDKTQCVGPEFVVRANQPPKILCVGVTKVTNFGRIVVILLTGQRIEVNCDPQKITAGELFQAIVQAESLDENFTLGLAALLAGDFAMLPAETKLNKVAPPGWFNNGKSKGTLGLPTSFMLYLRFRFFLPSLRSTRSWISKHLLYLQIRRCILEQQLVCPLAQLINLTGLALQAEFGNYSVDEHGRGDYFLLEHYIPESLILNPDLHLQQTQLPGGAETLRAQLHQAHRDRRGLGANNAEEMFITHAQALPDYGSHYYIATVDKKELEKIISRLKKLNLSSSRSLSTNDRDSYACTENIYQLDATSNCPIYGKIDFNHDNGDRADYTSARKIHATSKCANINEDIYAVPMSQSSVNIVEANNNNNNNNNNGNNGNNNKISRSKKSESNVWLAIHSQGLKLFERGGRPRDRTELVRLQWRDIQTLSYSKNSLLVYTRFNGKRCKFKLRMDHKKSYYAFKLTSLHHQFFLKLRSELTSLHGLAKDFGIPLTVEADSPPTMLKSESSEPKITLIDTAKNPKTSKYPMQLEEYQNKENENPQKMTNPMQNNDDNDTETVCYTPEEDALYAQVNARLEPEGASRDTEDESDRALTGRNGHAAEIPSEEQTIKSDDEKHQSYPSHGGLPCEKESIYSVPKRISACDIRDIDGSNGEIKNPEELYAAINKTGRNKKSDEYPIPDEIWDVANSKKSLDKVKTSSLPNYGTPRQSTGFQTPSLPRRLGVKMGTRAIYSSVVQRDSNLTDDLESLSIKSDTASSIQSASARSNDSPMPEAYVLNADIRTDDETFRIGNDETMSASLAARLEELSFAEERILHTIRLERGHGGSIGLQVTEGNDGGVYVQAISVGGSADMAGNVNKGDRIVAINGQSLLNLRYEEALKMLQSSSDTVELVLSQITSNRHGNLRRRQLQEPLENNYLHNLRFDVSSEAETSSMTTKWLSQRTGDVASVQNTSSAYSSAASSSMGNHNTNNAYITDVVDTNAYNSASMLLSLEDFDVSRTSLEIGAPPPVPPRRRRRKINANRVIDEPPKTAATRSIVDEHDTSSLSTGHARPERKSRSLPPPPPVPRSLVSRQKKSKSAIDSNSEPTSRDPKPLIRVITDGTAKPRFVVTKVTNIDDDETQCHDRHLVNPELGNENISGTSSPMPQTSSPLFFTFRDFEAVMEHSGKSDRSVDQRFDSIVIDDHPDPAEESEEDEKVCFRVTTTSVPFEKCLDSRDSAYDNRDFGRNFNEINYIFEDYTDRGKRLNRRASASSLFNDETFDNVDKDEPNRRNRRSATRVRFVLESPTPSIPDLDVEDTRDDLGKIDSVVITEIRNDRTKESPKSDEFGDVPFSSLIEDNLIRDPSESSDNNFNGLKFFEPNERKNNVQVRSNDEGDSTNLRNRENQRRARSTPSPRFASPRKFSIEPILDIAELPMPDIPTTYDPRDEGYVEKQWDGESKEDRESAKSINDGSRFYERSWNGSMIGESCRAARQAFVRGKLKSSSRETSNHDSWPNDDSTRIKVKSNANANEKISIDSALGNFGHQYDDDDGDVDRRETSDEEDADIDFDGEKILDINGPKNEVFADVKVRNSDSGHSPDTSLDNYPSLPGLIINDRDETNDERAFAGEGKSERSRSILSGNSWLFADSKANDVDRLPVNLRRNSFLENMLIDEDDNDDCQGLAENGCSIIAAHPKSGSPGERIVAPPLDHIHEEIIEESSGSLIDVARRDYDIVEREINGDGESKETSGKELAEEGVGDEPSFVVARATMATDFCANQNRRKSPCETKSDALNEMLRNFTAAKLKLAEPLGRRADYTKIDEMAEFVPGTEGPEVEERTTEASEGMKMVDGAEKRTPSVGTKFKEAAASIDSVDSQLNNADDFSASIESKEARIMKKLESEEANSLDIVPSDIEKTDDENLTSRRIDESEIVAIECTEDRFVTRRWGKNIGIDSRASSIDVARTSDKSDTIISVDECAIVRNIDNRDKRFDDNDNKAMTPVELSNDQTSRDDDVSAIIRPGSVRSFVELYEIQRDRTTIERHSKSNYSVTSITSSRGTISKEERWIADTYDSTVIEDKEESGVAGESRFNKMADGRLFAKYRDLDEIRVEDRGTEDFSTRFEHQDHDDAIEELVNVREISVCLREASQRDIVSSNIPVVAKRRFQESKSLRRFDEHGSPNESNKIVGMFYNDCDATMIVVNDDGARNAKTPKRRAPERPERPVRTRDRIALPDSTMRKTVGVIDDRGSMKNERLLEISERSNPTPSPRSNVSFVHSQIHQQNIQDGNRDNVESGIASSALLDTDVPQLRQPCVFYCRV